MSVLKINDFSIIEKVSSYNISRQDIIKSYPMANGDTSSYMIRKGSYTIDLNIVCNGSFYNALDSIIENNSEFTVIFTYAEAEHSAIMNIKSYKANCETLNGTEYWSISLSMTESRR